MLHAQMDMRQMPRKMPMTSPAKWVTASYSHTLTLPEPAYKESPVQSADQHGRDQAEP